MAIDSAEKRHKQNLKRRLRNRAAVSRVKTSIKKVEEALTAKKVEEAQKELKRAYSIIDQTASKGILHKNNAARKKSRLTALFNTLSTQPPQEIVEKAKPKKRAATTRKKKEAAA